MPQSTSADNYYLIHCKHQEARESHVQKIKSRWSTFTSMQSGKLVDDYPDVIRSRLNNARRTQKIKHNAEMRMEND